MKNKDLGLNLGTNEKSFYIIMTYQNTNNVDCICACMLHVYEFFWIKYTKYGNIQSKLISIHTCTCIEACMPTTLK